MEPCWEPEIIGDAMMGTRSGSASMLGIRKEPSQRPEMTGKSKKESGPGMRKGPFWDSAMLGTKNKRRTMVGTKYERRSKKESGSGIQKEPCWEPEVRGLPCWEL